MDIEYIKNYILENSFIPTILENLGCHHIKCCTDYYKCGNKDGNNNNAITVYCNDNLTTVDYTRQLSKEDRSHDIFDLVKFFEECNFFQAVKKVCEWIDLDYYTDPEEDLPESIKLTQLIYSLQKDDAEFDENKPIKPIPETILAYYNSYVNDMFAKDNISYQTQQEFEIGYDDFTNRITIPIRDEIGSLVGVKGRLFQNQISENENKYVYIEPCNRSQILYGLHKTMPYIERQGKVYVCESEKGVLQLWDMGICNAVATGGKKVSRVQIEKLTRLCCEVIFLFDKDVEREEVQSIADRFIDSVHVSAVFDDGNILDEKESPTDNPEKFKRLVKHMERLR
jgi:DNA primase